MPIYRVNVNQELLGQQIMNVFYYQTEGTLDATQMQEATDDIRTAWATFIDGGRVGPEWSLTGATFRQVDVPNLPEVTVVPTAGPLSGAATSQPMATQVALLVRGQANTPFPRRVRTYLGGLTEGALADGIWTSGAATAALTLVGVELDSIVVVNDVLERVSVRLGDEGEGEHVVASNRVVFYDVTRVPATQRRRRIGVGI